MLDLNQTSENQTAKPDENGQEERESNALPRWETPTLEDVSEEVMAQPYIRFT